jgi:hypothetical protein
VRKKTNRAEKRRKMKKQTLTKEQKQWLRVWKRLKALYRIVPKTPKGHGFRENLNGFFDECATALHAIERKNMVEVKILLTIQMDDPEGPLPTPEEVQEMVQREVNTWEFTRITAQLIDPT